MSSKDVKTFIQTNIWPITSLVLAGVSLYVTSIVKPLADSISSLAQENKEQEQSIQMIRDKSVKVDLNELRIEKIEGNIVEIKQSQLRMEDKIDQLKD